MGRLRFHIAMSLDGYVAGPDQSERDPIGVGGMQLHEWLFPLAAFRKLQGEGDDGEVNESTPVVEGWFEGVGATIMGRNMFGGGRGEWPEPPWNGWWGENPPYHHPVFVLTHHAREPLELEGGTTFHFVTDGIESALERANEAAGKLDVSLAGGADVARQYLAAGLVDEMELSVVPVILSSGERLFDPPIDPSLRLEQTRLVGAPGVAHLRYRLG
jgi:dihydrofolate reductase